MQLSPHQEAALAFIREHAWCTINHFCGTGKTRIGLETIKRYTIRGTWYISVVVVPRLSLIHQWHQKLREMKYDGEFLSINSDEDDRDTCASIEFTTDEEEIKCASTNMCITITYKSIHLLEETAVQGETDEEISGARGVKNARYEFLYYAITDIHLFFFNDSPPHL